MSLPHLSNDQRQRPILGLIFSRDRAYQLDAVLRSFRRHCRDRQHVNLVVLYSNTKPEFDRRYEQLAKEYSEVRFFAETDFRTQVLTLVREHAAVLFMVDDNIFVESFDLKLLERALLQTPRALGGSLRLGQNTSYCFSLNIEQPPPRFTPLENELFKYLWQTTAGDFGYPLEVSSSLYLTTVVEPILEKMPFRNPNTLEAGLAAAASGMSRSYPELICYETSRAFCVPLNLVQNEFQNRAANDSEMTAESLGRRYDAGWRVDVARMKGFQPPACHHLLALPEINVAGKYPADVDPFQTTISVVIPCFNQGRFLTDCLESLASQTEPPQEVLVVNDGSTDAETLAYFERLPNYQFPFLIRVLHKPNGGVSSARNWGIDRARCEIVVLLDGDDKLPPVALEEYRLAFGRQPEIDVFYPDMTTFGNEHQHLCGSSFNAWRQTQTNYLLSSSAVRRRVFDAGYRFDERLRKGFEDWDFWTRVCALGPFRAAPLKVLAFYYRQWGYSMLSAVDHDNVVAQIRSNHAAAGIWNESIADELRRTTAPSHCLFSRNPKRYGTHYEFCVNPEGKIAEFLSADLQSRYVWFGHPPADWIAAMQMTVHGALAAHSVAAVAFVDSKTNAPFAIVYDRYWFLKHTFGYWKRSANAGPVVVVETRGQRQMVVTKITRYRRSPNSVRQFAGDHLGNRRVAEMLPAACHTDCQVAEDAWRWLAQPADSTFSLKSHGGERVLVVALPWLTYGGADFATLSMLEEASLRRRFDRIVVLVFHDGDHPAHERFESLVDEIVHLGNLGLDDETKLSLAVDLCRSLRASHLLINNSQHGYDMIPRLRKLRLPICITAQVHGYELHPQLGTLTEGYPKILASRYANQIDRVATISDMLASRMIEELYFPSAKIKTVRLGVDQSRFHPTAIRSSERPQQFVWIGRLENGKDPLLALEVAAAYHKTHGDARFVFVGNGPLAKEFGKKLRREQNSGLDAVWIQQSDRVDEILKNSDCLFMTTKHEGIPIVVMEAFSCGLPVVMCLSNTAAAEIADSGRFFPVADRTSVAETADRLHAALANSQLYPESAQLSRERYAQEMIDWLFAENADSPAQSISVFGVGAAA